MPRKTADSEPPRARTRGHELLTLAILLVPLAWRGLLLVERRQSFDTPDLRGILADLAVGVVAVVLITLLARASRWLAVVGVLFWSVSNYVAYEHVQALGTLPRFAYGGELFDPTFIGGSVLGIAHPLGLLLATAMLVAVVLRLRLDADWPRRVLVGALAGAGLTGVLIAWPAEGAVMRWRQKHVLPTAFHDLIWRPADATADVPPDVAVSDDDRERIARALRVDLDGPRRFERVESPVNVLLVLLEGVSGAHLASFREHAGVSADFDLPHIDRFARTHLAWPNFLVHQRQTNRGTYSILAGEWPHLSTRRAKMSEVAGRQTAPRPYLPAVMRSHGYATVYLQAAPIAYMMKNRFMPLAGFDVVEGEASWPQAYARNNWGVDDRAFLEQSLDRLVALDAEHEPWFATLLTAGTHHPYVVPDDYRPGEADFLRALRYLDESFGAFMDRLESSGLLERTLLIVTSDESAGLPGLDGPLAWLDRHWGFVAARTPGGDRGVIADGYAQRDLALSILDYVGLDSASSGFTGRSLFRDSATSRPLFFGDTYAGHLGVFDEDGEVHVFDERMEPIFRGTFDPERMFDVSAIGETPDRAGLVWEAVRRSAGASATDWTSLVLADRERRTISGAQDDESYLLGGQNISVDRDRLLRFEFDVTVIEGTGRVRLRNKVEAKDGFPGRFASDWLAPGDRYRVTGVWRTGGPCEGATLKSLADAEDTATSIVLEVSARFEEAAPHEVAGEPLWPGEVRLIADGE